MRRQTISARSIVGTNVVNQTNEDIGTIEDVMVNIADGNVAYLVLSYGGIFGTTWADKRFAVPFNAFAVREEGDGDVHYVLNVSKQMLESAPGFDKDRYPDFADAQFQQSLSTHYSAVRAPEMV